MICAFALDGRGGGQELDWDAVRAWNPDAGPLWLHLDYTADDVRAWLTEDSGLDPIAVAALTAEAPRPRSERTGDGLVVIERVINLNEGADPEDMVSVRVWLDEHRVITMRHRRVNALKMMRQRVRDGCGPRTASGLLVEFTELVLDRMALVVDKIDDHANALEDTVVADSSRSLRPQLADLRRQAIALRRYIAPQRDVLARLQTERTDLLTDAHRLRLRECADRLTRFVEDLDSARDRAAVTQEELASRLSESMDQRLYVLAIVSMVFLPLGFITGALGVNVGGMPGTGYEHGFWIMVAALTVLTGGQLWLFRRLRWL